MDVKERFKLSGLTVTLQRIKIYEAIKKLDHPTPEEILNNLKDEIPSFSVSAVYSNLSLLLSHKLSISGVSVEQHDLLLYGKCSQCKLTTNSYS